LINNEFKFNFETTNFEVLQRNGKQDPINFQNNREKIEPKIVFSRILSEKQHEIQEIENAISNSYQNQNVVETINQTVNSSQKTHLQLNLKKEEKWKFYSEEHEKLHIICKTIISIKKQIKLITKLNSSNFITIELYKKFQKNNYSIIANITRTTQKLQNLQQNDFVQILMK
jgi:hypothetical protein